MQPSTFIPKTAGDFIGPSGKLARLFEAKAKAHRESGAPIKLLLYGAPGTGKTRLAEMLAGLLAGHASQIETVNGRNVDIGKVREWQDRSCYRGMNGGFTVKVINETDTLNPAAQDLLLTYLDEMKDWSAFVGTCNSNLAELTPRFQSRLQQFNVKIASMGEIAELLKRFGLNGNADRIADKCGGNVRAALLDAQSVLDAAAIA